MALAVRLGADRHFDNAIGGDADVGIFIGAATAGDFDIIGDAAAKAQAVFRSGSLAGRKAGPIGLRQRLVEHGGEVADVESEANAVIVRQFGGRQQVLAPNRINANAGFARRGFDQPLHDVR